MGLFDRKKPKEEENSKSPLEEMKEISQRLKELNKDRNYDILFMVSADGEGISHVQGTPQGVAKVMEATAAQDKEFAVIIKAVASQIPDDMDTLRNMLPPELKQLADDMMEKPTGATEKFKLKDGTQGLAVKGDNIENMTDKDIDDIIDNIVKGINDNNEEKS